MWVIFLKCELLYSSTSFFDMVDLSRIELYAYVSHVFWSVNYYFLVQLYLIWLTCLGSNCMYMWVMFLKCELLYFSTSFLKYGWLVSYWIVCICGSCFWNVNYYILVQASSIWLTCLVSNCMHMWVMFLKCELLYSSASFLNMVGLSRIVLHAYVCHVLKCELLFSSTSIFNMVDLSCIELYAYVGHVFEV